MILYKINAFSFSMTTSQTNLNIESAIRATTFESSSPPPRKYDKLKKEKELRLEKERKRSGTRYRRKYGRNRVKSDIKGFRSIQMKGKCIKLKFILLDMHI